MPAQDDKQIADSRAVLRESEKETQPYEVEVCGRKFVVNPGVFSPKYFGSTKIFCKVFPYRDNDTLLEIGCGTGIISVTAALNGSSRVVAVDINPLAVENTKINAFRHRVASVVTARVSDIYSAIKPGELFDTIFWNSNFIFANPEFRVESMLERSLFDPGYRNHEEFLGQARKYLRSGGRVLLGFGDFGEMDIFHDLCNKYRYSIREIERGGGVEGKPVHFILYELTPLR